MTDNSLRRLVIGDAAATARRVLVTAGVHGDEFEPMVAVMDLAERLRSLDVQGLVTLVPIVNAAAYARRQRTAEDGLDLARVCPGKPDGSITEQTADELSRLIRASDYYIDLHTGGAALTLSPLAGYLLHPDRRVLDVQRRMARAFNLPLVWGTSPSLQGRSLSIARDANVPAIYVEYGGGGAFDAGAVRALTTGCLGVLQALGILNSRPPESQATAPVVIEDLRDQSGHLQVSHLSPAEGIFEATIPVGGWVRRESVIGRVHDPALKKPVDAVAEQTGIVVMLRCFAGVQRGEALAAIAPLDHPPGKDRDAH